MVSDQGKPCMVSLFVKNMMSTSLFLRMASSGFENLQWLCSNGKNYTPKMPLPVLLTRSRAGLRVFALASTRIRDVSTWDNSTPRQVDIKKKTKI
ncbi:unnamed protein product, partial [Trichogramma brassicae]